MARYWSSIERLIDRALSIVDNAPSTGYCEREWNAVGDAVNDAYDAKETGRLKDAHAHAKRAVKLAKTYDRCEVNAAPHRAMSEWGE